MSKGEYKTKLLLYCTKAKTFITRGTSGEVYPSCVISDGIQEWHLNGKIVAECDFEVEAIRVSKLWLNEYKAQIEQLGYYKEDLHILNQEIQKGLCITGIIFSLIFIIINIICIINIWLDN